MKKRCDVTLYAPKSFWEADPAYVDKLTNGCGPGGFGDKLVPDTLYGLSVFHACRIHDWYYGPEMPGSFDCKAEADRVFLNNMVRIVKAKTRIKILLKLRLIRARTYYQAVKHFGGDAFWKNKNGADETRTISI
jgi:hypothetical protein